MIKRLIIVLAGIAAFVFVPWLILEPFIKYAPIGSEAARRIPVLQWLQGLLCIGILSAIFLLIKQAVEYIKHG